MKWITSLFKNGDSIEELARYVLKNSLACADLLKNDISERVHDDKEYQSRYLIITCEATFFFLHLINRKAWEILGEEKRSHLQDALYPLVIESTLNALNRITYNRNIPSETEKAAKDEFINNLNNSEIEYSECKKLYTIPGEFAGEGDSALHKLVSGKPRYGLVNQFIDNVYKVIVNGEVCLDISFQIRIHEFIMDIMKKQEIETLVKRCVIKNKKESINKFDSDEENEQGTRKYPDGTTFDGEFKDGEPWQGTCTYPDGTIYVGEFKEGMFNGHGTIKYTNGALYVGEFKEGQRNGQGTYTWPNGQEHIGEFKDDRANGQGTMTWPDGQRYVGEFMDGESNGWGTGILPDGRKYVGEFKNSEYNGQGTMTWPDGSIYAGEFKNGNINGQGSLTWPSGAKYVGEFKDGKRNGQGTMKDPDGARQKGVWKNDVFVG